MQNIFDGNLLIIAGFVSFIFDYIICRGLLYNREGSFSDYISGIKTMTGKVFLMNILAGAIAVILLTLAMLASGAGFLFTSYSVENPKVFVSFVVLFTLAIIFTSLLFAYMNFFMADDRYRDLAFFKSLKLIVKAGIKLFSESFMAGVKAYKITLISTAIVIVVLLFTPVAGQIALIFGVIAVIALFFCTPTFRASLSDIYLDRSEEIYEEVMGNKN